MATYKCPKGGEVRHINTLDRVQNLMIAPFDMINKIMSGGANPTMIKTSYCEEHKCGMVRVDDD